MYVFVLLVKEDAREHSFDVSENDYKFQEMKMGSPFQVSQLERKYSTNKLSENNV
jgi:hypothetical protein